MMSPTARLHLILAALSVSMVYGVLVGLSPSFARTVAIGYIAAMISVLLIVNLWKKPHP